MTTPRKADTVTMDTDRYEEMMDSHWRDQVEHLDAAYAASADALDAVARRAVEEPLEFARIEALKAVLTIRERIEWVRHEIAHRDETDEAFRLDRAKVQGVGA